MTAMDVRYWGFFMLGLLSLMLLMGGMALWWQGRRLQRSQQRLPGVKGRAQPPKTGATAPRRSARWLSASPRLAQWLARLPGIASYDRMLLQTAWPISSAEAVVGSVALALGVLSLGALLATPFVPTLLVALAAVLYGGRGCQS